MSNGVVDAIHDKPTIAVDIDEVLCKFIEPLTVFASKHFGATETEADFFR